MENEVTLRDQIAMAAIQGFCVEQVGLGNDEFGYLDSAREAYRLADAMLQARKEPKP